MLYTQLLYFSSMFDTEKAKANSADTTRACKLRLYKGVFVIMKSYWQLYIVDIAELANRHITEFAELKKTVDQYLDRSGRRFVDLSQLFSFCTI